MGRKLKNFMFLVVLSAAGYFTYQYFVVPWLEATATEESDPSEHLMFLPDQCQAAGEYMVNAFYKNKNGEITRTAVSSYRKRFRECLRDAGYDDSQVNEVYDKIADSADYKG